MALNSKNIKSQVADHSFYSNVSTRPIIAPIVSIDDCYGTVYCEGDYNLVVFDTETATNLGEYAADGLCDRYTQTWLVDDLISGGFTFFQRLYATCVDYKDYGSCKPNDKLPLLFAYSNDFDSNLISSLLKFLWSPDYSIIANVRFDAREEQQIEYHTKKEDWVNSIHRHLPDPSLKFPTIQTGSDVLKVIEKFLDNTKHPVCGAKIVIISKRYPNEFDIPARIVQKLRGYHIYLHISASTSPSGGYQKNTLYNLAAQTNGFCLFDNDDRLELAIDWEFPFVTSYLAYAVNRQVSGQGIIELPPQLPYEFESHYTSISFQDTVESFPYSRVTFRWENNNSSEAGTSSSTAFNEFLEYGGAEHGQYNIGLDLGVNKLFLEYNYADDKVRTIQIRMRIFDEDVDHWLPYDN